MVEVNTFATVEHVLSWLVDISCINSRDILKLHLMENERKERELYWK